MSKRLIPGGEELDGSVINPATGQGVHAKHPAGTPKYNTRNDYAAFHTQARMFIELPNLQMYEEYKRRVPERSRELLDVLSPQGGTGGMGFFDFLLQGVSESYQEKVQISEVLSDGFISYFFGQRAPVWSLQGVLLNTQQDSWYDAFQVLYQDVLRGTRLAQNRVSLKLAYDSKVLDGALLALNTSLSADMETAVSFSAQFVVTNIHTRDTDRITVTDVAGVLETQDPEMVAKKQATTQVFGSVNAALAASGAAGQAIGAAAFVRNGYDSQAMAARIRANFMGPLPGRDPNFMGPLPGRDPNFMGPLPGPDPDFIGPIPGPDPNFMGPVR